MTRYLVTDCILGRAQHRAKNHTFQLRSDLFVSSPGADLSGLVDQVALVEAIAARWRDRLLRLDGLGFGPSGRGAWNARIDGVALAVVDPVGVVVDNDGSCGSWAQVFRGPQTCICPREPEGSCRTGGRPRGSTGHRP